MNVQSIKTLSNVTKIFSGSIESLSCFLKNEENLRGTYALVKEELNETLVLYTTDLEENYKSQIRTKRRRTTLSSTTLGYYVDLLVTSNVRFGQLSPRSRATIFLAADIPFAMSAAVSFDSFSVYIEQLLDRSDAAKIAPGDMVGVVAAQSISEQFTQSTLNSVDYETCMVVRWTSKDGPPPVPADDKVGTFVDALITQRPNDIKLQPDGVTVYLPLKSGEAEALSTDDNGNMVWTALEAVTRHPPINDDGTNMLVKVRVGSGHECVVTRGESMLIVREGKVVKARGDEVRIGDMVPVTAQLPTVVIVDHLDLRTVFKKTEYLFTDEIIDAFTKWIPGRASRWFADYGFKNRLPYTRSDSVIVAIKNNRPYLVDHPGMVAHKQGVSRKSDGMETMLPVSLKLDRDFGFFLGAFLAEGCVCKYQLIIANNDKRYRDATQRWPDTLGITNHLKVRRINGGTSTSLRFPSRLLVEFMTAICGVNSYNKRVPAFALTAPDEFVKGLLDAYFSGDGRVDPKGISITAASRSQNLLDGISHLLARYGIHTILSTTHRMNHIKWMTGEDGTRTQENYGDNVPLYHLRIRSAYSRKFATHVTLTVGYKQAQLDTYIGRRTNKKSRKEHETMNDIQLQPIVSITEQPSSHPMVYDLTVAGTRNMCTTSGFHIKDTFHTAGSKSSAVVGFKRIMEILDATRKLRVPVLGPIEGDGIERLFEKRLIDYGMEYGIVWRPDFASLYKKSSRSVPNNSFHLYVKLSNPSDWENYISVSPHLPKTVLKRMFCSDGVVYVSFPESSTYKDILVAKGIILERQVYGLPGCYRYVPEEKILVFKPQVPLAKIRSSDDASVNVVDHGMIDDVVGVGVDFLKLYSNDIYYIQSTLGIAAAETFITMELKRTLASEGININERHLNLITANMTVSGHIKPNKFGGVDMDESVFLKATFQESTTTFSKAAAEGTVDELIGVSSQILLGVKPTVGLGTVSLTYPDVGPVVERVVERVDDPPYCPSPEYTSVDSPCYQPTSPCYQPTSPCYQSHDEEILEPIIHI